MSKIINKLSKEWKKSGINEGDCVLIHSSLKRLIVDYSGLGYELTPTIILESFLKAVGKNGTLMFPLFNFNFPKSKSFDFAETPSQMGALTEVARKYQGSVRTGHPIYSFAVIGYYAELFSKVDNYSGYGIDSPFTSLMNLNGKIAILDLPDQNSMTFYHYIEEFHRVKYRYYKEFSGEYIDETGRASSKTYTLFVRKIEDGVLTEVDLTGELLWKNRIYSGSNPFEGNGLRTANARDVFDFVTKEIINKNKAKGLLYSVKNNS